MDRIPLIGLRTRNLLFEQPPLKDSFSPYLSLSLLLSQNKNIARLLTLKTELETETKKQKPLVRREIIATETKKPIALKAAWRVN